MLVALIVLMLQSTFWTAVAEAQTVPAGTIAGTVVARDTGRPVAYAAILIEGANQTAVGNVNGGFRLEGVPPGQVALRIRAAGFSELRVPGVSVRANDVTTLEIELDVTPNFIERVQVTATKAPVSVGDVPAPTDIIDRATIELRGEQTLPQVVAHVPGAVVSTQLGIFDSVMFRGMPRGDPEFTNTLLLVDGVPQTLSNNGARVVALPINDASAIEIVRGPNSALYGRTAIGGSVNVHTADPTPSHHISGEFTTGEFEMLKGVMKASGPIKRWGGYYVSAGRERNHGYFVNKTNSDFSVGNWALFGKLAFTTDPRAAGSVSVNRVLSTNSTPTNEPIIDGRLLHEIEPGFDRFTNFNIPGPNYRQGETRVTLNYARDLSARARAVEVFGYRRVQHKFIDDGDFIGSPLNLAAHTVTMYPFSQQLDEDIFYQEFRVELTGRSTRVRQSLMAGGSYEWNSGSLASDFIFNDPDLFGFTINYLNPIVPPRSEWQQDEGSRTYHLGVTGVFTQYTIEPAPRVIMTAGGRYDRLDLDVTRMGSSKVEDVFDAFSPKASVLYRLMGPDDQGGPTLNVYGAYSQSFLPPRRPSALVPADVPLKLRPEEIANYEGGLKASLAEGRVALEASYFRMTEDGVVLSTRQGPFFLPTNAGKLRFKGFETGVTGSVSSRVSLFFNASFYRNRFGHFVIESDEGDTVLTGNRLPISPDHVVNWGTSFRPASSVNATLTVKHMGNVQTNRDNTFMLDAFDVVDAAVSWQHARLRITLSAHNLFDEEYYWNGDGETADPGRPRQILVTTSFLFR
jgi:outer membrane receptor protein involved in Fe transport